MKKTKDVMSSSVHTVQRSDNLIDAARRMLKTGCGALPVVDGDELVGIVTDRDLVLRGLAEKKDAEHTKIGEVMTPEPHSVRPDDDITKTAEMMTRERIRRALVVDDRGELVGLVALADLCHRGGETERELGDRVLHAVSAPPS